ncbi:hypothetical protein BC829DRAFT_432324 [Chytridium lagenaria]|nr:hypothetical protein BC829DRAFT_432324 [Chytridium lagenaria]
MEEGGKDNRKSDGDLQEEMMMNLLLSNTSRSISPTRERATSTTAEVEKSSTSLTGPMAWMQGAEYNHQNLRLNNDAANVGQPLMTTGFTGIYNGRSGPVTSFSFLPQRDEGMNVRTFSVETTVPTVTRGLQAMQTEAVHSLQSFFPQQTPQQIQTTLASTFPENSQFHLQQNSSIPPPLQTNAPYSFPLLQEGVHVDPFSFSHLPSDSGATAVSRQLQQQQHSPVRNFQRPTPPSIALTEPSSLDFYAAFNSSPSTDTIGQLGGPSDNLLQSIPTIAPLPAYPTPVAAQSSSQAHTPSSSSPIRLTPPIFNQNPADTSLESFLDNSKTYPHLFYNQPSSAVTAFPHSTALPPSSYSDPSQYGSTSSSLSAFWPTLDVNTMSTVSSSSLQNQPFQHPSQIPLFDQGLPPLAPSLPKRSISPTSTTVPRKRSTESPTKPRSHSLSIPRYKVRQAANPNFTVAPTKTSEKADGKIRIDHWTSRGRPRSRTTVSPPAGAIGMGRHHGIERFWLKLAQVQVRSKGRLDKKRENGAEGKEKGNGMLGRSVRRNERSMAEDRRWKQNDRLE